jgi:hypothetical protein
MARIGKLRTLEGGRVAFMCPGCNGLHQIRVQGEGGPMWAWNGSHDAPTFTPSVLVTGVQAVNDANGNWTGEYVRDANGEPLPLVCHSFVTDGWIQYLGDCTHALAGQTVELPVPA